jgi:5'-deoxynucleotidase YfbR-like HD superfamily hydrolase
MNTPVIKTFTGLEINPLDVGKENINIEDIAHALALCNRFAGHTRVPVSVAQHCVYVSRVARALGWADLALCNGDADKIGFQGLLHDASEAYLGDVTKWLKEDPAMSAYRQAEARVQDQIYRKFGCWVLDHRLVKEADRVMCRFEAERTMPPMTWSPDYPPIDKAMRARIGHWRPWSWQTAEEVFLAEFRLLNK